MAAPTTNSPLFAGLPPLPTLAGAEPERIAMDAFRLAIADGVTKIYPEIPLQAAYEAVAAGASVKGADASIATPRFKMVKGNPKEIAEKIAKEFVPNDWISSAVYANTPFVTFTFHTPTLNRVVLQQINQLNHMQDAEASTSSSAATNGSPASSVLPTEIAVKTGYGTNTSGTGKNMLIDFSSPNIAKPFHAGHLRSTIIGMFVANIYTANGWNVTKMNYLGDWGKQYGILAVGFDRYGDEEKLQADPIKHLYDVYVAINDDARKEVAEYISKERKRLLEEAKGEKVMIMNDKKQLVELVEGMDTTRTEAEAADAASPIHTQARQLFRRMEDSEPEALAIWKRFRDLSIERYKLIYKRLNINFDIYWGESQVKPESQESAVKALQEKNLVYEEGGALLCDLGKKMGKVLIRKRDGTTLYMTRDIGGAKERHDTYKFDKSIYVVAAQQDLHFQQLFKILELMEYPWHKDCQHVNFGMVAGMSTRKGTVVFLEDILNEAQEVMHAQMKSNEEKYAQIEDPEYTSDVVGITGVKIQDMAGKRGNNYTFDWKRMLSFEGDTGPYLQYAHVRLASVERKSAAEVVLPPHAERAQSINTDLITEPKAREIIYQLASYPDVVKKACTTLEPSNLVTFLFRLCHSISSAWETLIVRGQDRELALARLWLFVSARDVIASAMKMLSLTPLERM